MEAAKTYMEKAEVRMYSMDLEEIALRAAQTEFEADTAEKRLVSMKIETEQILARWKTRKKEYARMISESKKESETIGRKVNGLCQSAAKHASNSARQRQIDFGSEGIARKEDELKRQDCLRAECLRESQRSLEKEIYGLKACLVDLCEAIGHLSNYLYQESVAVEPVDVPFSSNIPPSVWGVTAEEPTYNADEWFENHMISIEERNAPKHSTPQEAAMLLVNDIIDCHSHAIALSWQEAQADPRTEFTILEQNKWFQLLVKFGMDEIGKNEVGYFELERACDSDDMQKYIMVMNSAIQEELS